MSIIYIYGPQGCGKTTNKQRFQRHFMMPVYEEDVFFDDTTKQLRGVVVLGGEKPIEGPPKTAYNVINMSFDEAMEASKDQK